MIIKRVNLNSFGKFNNKEIEFSEGLNIVYGHNESGKTTVHRFIDGMFYGFLKPNIKFTKYSQEHEKYEPWHKDRYTGSMNLSINGQEYRIERNFKKGMESTKVFIENTGEEITTDIHMGRGKVLQPGLFFFNFNETMYSNSISIKQLGVAVDKDLSNEVRERLINMTTTLDNDISIESAVKHLDKNIKDIGSIKAPTSNFGIVYNRNIELEKQRTEILKSKEEYKRLLIQDEILKNKLNLLNEEIIYEKKCLRILLFNDKEKKYKRAIEIENENKKLSSIMQDNKYDNKYLETEVIYDNYQYKEDEILKDYLLFDEIEDRINEFIYIKSSSNLESLIINRNNMLKNKRKIDIMLVLFVLIYLVGSIIVGTQSYLSFLAGIQLLIIPIYIFFKKQKDEKKYILNISKKIYNLKCDIENQELDVTILQSQLKEILGKYQLTDKYELKSVYELEKLNRQKSLQEYEKNLIRNALYEDARSQFKNNSITMEYLLNGNSLEGLKTELEKTKPEESLEVDFTKEELGIKIENTEDEINKLNLERKGIEERINILLPEVSKLIFIEEEIDNNNTKLEYWADRKNSLELAKSTIIKISKEIHNEVAPIINNKVANIITKITDDKYREIRINDNLDISVIDPSTKQMVGIDNLSGGTIDQLYFSLRFAILTSMSEDKFPLLLDDSFIQYDDRRLTNILNILIDISQKRQVVLFTCQKRELHILNRLSQGFNSILLD